MRKSLHTSASRKRAIEMAVSTKSQAFAMLQKKVKMPLLAGVGVFCFTRISAEEAVAEEVSKEETVTVEKEESAAVETEEASAIESAKIAAEEVAAAEAAAAQKVAAEKAAAEKIAAEEAEAARIATEKAAAAEKAAEAEKAKIAEEGAARDTWEKAKTAGLVVFVSWIVLKQAGLY
jgi:hypothetical protein